MIFVVVDDDDNEDCAVQVVSRDTASVVHWKVRDSILGRDGDFSEGFHGFPQFLYISAKIIPQIWMRLLPLTSFPIRLLLFIPFDGMLLHQINHK
jgi:hypothetical protein